MPDPITPQLDTVVTHSSLEEILRAVLADVVSEDKLIRLVNGAVDNRVENMRQLISGIDGQQRNSFQDFKDASKDFRTTSEQLRQTMTDVNARVVRTETNQETDARRISDVLKRVEAHDNELESLREQVNQIKTVQGELHIDIHGDATQALRPSIHGLLTDMSKTLNERLGNIEADQREIKAHLKAHDQYIERRKAFETWVMKVVKGLWEKQLTRWVLITGLPIVGGLFVAAADPRIADGIAKFISLLLAGK